MYPPPLLRGEDTDSPGGEGDGGSIFWKTREIGLPFYNDLSTVTSYNTNIQFSSYWGGGGCVEFIMHRLGEGGGEGEWCVIVMANLR